MGIHSNLLNIAMLLQSLAEYRDGSRWVLVQMEEKAFCYFKMFPPGCQRAKNTNAFEAAMPLNCRTDKWKILDLYFITK